MRLPRVQIFPRILSDEFKKTYPLPKDGEVRLFLSYVWASNEIQDALLAWAAESVGPSYRALLGKIVEMENKGIVVNHITTRWDATDLLEDFGGELSSEATLKRREERMPDWMKAWEKITRPWIVPPTLTDTERKHIEKKAEEILSLINAPDAEGPPSVFETPPTP